MSVDTIAPTLPPQAVVMQMVTGGYVARALSEISRLGVPDILQKAGPLSAAALVSDGVHADVSTLERVIARDPGGFARGRGNGAGTAVADVRHRVAARMRRR